jgi:membrane-associated protein
MAALPHALTTLPTAAAVAVVCVLVVAEIVAVPGMLLPGGTVTLLAGALIGTGRPALAVALPVAAAVIGGDQLAYFTGAAVIGWWRRRRPGRITEDRPPRRGRAAKWLTAAMPSLAGAAHLPYRSFVPRLIVMRLLWLTGLLASGALAARSLTAIGRVAGIAGLVGSVVVVASLLAVHGRLRLPVRAIARALRAPQGRLAALLVTAALAAWVCGNLLQDTAANVETVQLNPRVAGLLARHVPPDAASSAIGLSHLVQPPGLWIMAALAVAVLNVRRRGRSTIRIVAATAVSLAVAAILNTTLPGWDRHLPVSLGAAAIAALAITTVFFAARWLNPLQTGTAAAVIGLAAAGLALALALAGQPFTALGAGASLGTAIAAAVEAVTRLRCGRWLADPPPPTPASA